MASEKRTSREAWEEYDRRLSSEELEVLIGYALDDIENILTEGTPEEYPHLDELKESIDVKKEILAERRTT